MLSKLLLAAFTAGALCVAPCIDARKITKHQMKVKQLEAANRWKYQHPTRATSGGVQNFTFSNPKAARKYSNFIAIWHGADCMTDVLFVDFWVDGSNIPEVHFDVGPSWSGLLPISSNPGETRKVCIMLGQGRGMLLKWTSVNSAILLVLPTWSSRKQGWNHFLVSHSGPLNLAELILICILQDKWYESIIFHQFANTKLSSWFVTRRTWMLIAWRNAAGKWRKFSIGLIINWQWHLSPALQLDHWHGQTYSERVQLDQPLQHAVRRTTCRYRYVL